MKNLLPLLLVALSSTLTFGNETSIMFDGKNDLYGLTRQTSIDANTLTFVPELSFSDEGIDFLFERKNTECKGFALVNAGGTDAGLLVAPVFPSSTNTPYPQITMTVPGGEIAEVKLYMSGDGLYSVYVPFNNVSVESVAEGRLFSWTWTAENIVDKVTMKIDNSFHNRFIHSIEVTYYLNTPGKKGAGVTYNKKKAEVILGEPFNYPKLSNPNDLPITYSSSDESVAVIDAEGTVTPLSGGKTVIKASTPGNDQFVAGSAIYTLTVVPVADDIPQMMEVAPQIYDRVMVNFPMTVTYAYNSNAYVIDDKGNAGLIENTKNQGTTSQEKIYEVGDVIPSQWIASNFKIYSEVTWQGLPAEPTEVVEVKYPLVESVTPADNFRVVTMRAIKFETATPHDYEKGFGTAPDGREYEFQDIFNLGSHRAGTYDVTVVVCYSKVMTKEYFYLAPIAFSDPTPVGINETDTDTTAPVRYFNLQGIEVQHPTKGIYLMTKGTHTSKILL